jgi:hypothetical protein
MLNLRVARLILVLGFLALAVALKPHPAAEIESVTNCGVRSTPPRGVVPFPFV